MKKLNKPSDNLGGVLKLWAVPKGDFSINGQSVSFSTTDNIYKIYCSPESVSFEESAEHIVAGVFYNCKISGFIPSDSFETRSALLEMEGLPFAIVFFDGNENYKLAGTSAYPLRMNSVYSSGRSATDRSGYEISFSGKTITRAAFIENPF